MKIILTMIYFSGFDFIESKQRRDIFRIRLHVRYCNRKGYQRHIENDNRFQTFCIHSLRPSLLRFLVLL